MTTSKDEEDLTDEVLADEIELVGALVAAAAESPGPMSQDDIDEALGVTHEARAHDEASGPTRRRRSRRGRPAKAG